MRKQLGSCDNDATALAVKYLHASRKASRNEEEEELVRIVEECLDEVSTFWDMVAAQLPGLPLDFFSKNGDWPIRARKFFAVYEPLDVANWYRYQELLVPGKAYSDSTGGRPHRPVRYVKLSAQLRKVGMDGVRDVRAVDEGFVKACGPTK
ncbi:hypothetical protein GPECTOR_24g203 [Gonium pectorale]|uniref:EDS1 EP domain-containing protein n=1 Tax=Gonium pectorale TaxID=33097 RepID=A0A150GGH4_GONPE|nr:hypothetical protein GPECTOR_24g203 [Gonium pectorale]|eukprot:KXZ48914.1 hypothetical protein GPECTOR_24g203 [Gonium pectorale]